MDVGVRGGRGGLPDTTKSATPVAAKAPVAELQTRTHTNSACKQGGENQEGQKTQIKTHTGPTHPRAAEAETYQMEISQHRTQTGVHD